MDLYLGSGMYVKTYRVGLGEKGSETPLGRWKVKANDKLITPNWTHPKTGRVYVSSDTDYPLGSRWIGIQGVKGDAVGRTGFALHGTSDPNSIGTLSSMGCVRLNDPDIIEVFNLLQPGQSEIRILE